MPSFARKDDSGVPEVAYAVRGLVDEDHVCGGVGVGVERVCETEGGLRGCSVENREDYSG